MTAIDTSKLTAGERIEARLHNQEWDGNTGTFVRSFANGQHLFIPDVEPGRYQLADDIRPIPKDPDGELRRLALSFVSHYNDAGDNEGIKNFFVEDFIRLIKSLLAAKVPTDEEIEKEAEKRSPHLYPRSFSHGAKWMRSHFTKNETK